VIVEGSNLDGTRIENGIPRLISRRASSRSAGPTRGGSSVTTSTPPLRAGDAVLSKGTRTSAEEFEALAA